MDTNERIHIESLKSLILFFESYSQDNSYYIKYSHKKHVSSKKNKKRFSPDIKTKIKTHSNDNITNSPKPNHRSHHHKKNKIKNDLFKENQLYNENCYKSLDKPIKKNFVNQKFKIADDFNEENSNKFLNEKDECLKEVILSDKIKREKFIPFNVKDEKENLYEISSIKQNEDNNIFNNSHNKRGKYIDDSTTFLSELIDDLK